MHLAHFLLASAVLLASPVPAAQARVQPYQPYINERYGFSINIPASFRAQPPPDNGDGRTFRSSDGRARLLVYGSNDADLHTIAERFDEAVKAAPGTVGYTKLSAGWFVLTSSDNRDITYQKTFQGTASTNTFLFTYPVEQKASYAPVIKELERSFQHGKINEIG